MVGSFHDSIPLSTHLNAKQFNDRLWQRAWWVTINSLDLLIHSADPQSRPRPVASDHYFHYCLSIRLSIPKLQNYVKITAGRDCGLAEWLIDDSNLEIFYLHDFSQKIHISQFDLYRER